jgi:hypothetical protein
MQQRAGRHPAPIAGILALVGGAVMAVASFLSWAEVSGGGTNVSATGTDGSDGWITLAAGVVVFIAGILLLRGSGRRAVAILALVFGLIGGGIGLYDALTAKDRVLDDAAEELASSTGSTTAQVRALLDAAIDAGEITLSISVGLYLVIAGGALGVVGGVLGMRGGAAATVAEPVPAAGAAPSPSAPGATQTPTAVPSVADAGPMPAPPASDTPPLPPPPPGPGGGEPGGGPTVS